MNNLRIERVLSKPERYENAEYSDSEKSATVEWFDNDGLPLLVFGWRPSETFYGLTDEQADALEDAGFKIETYDNGNRRCCSVISKNMQYVTFCNFRRYGWSWAPGHQAKDGYAGGHTYANGPAFGVDLSPELVIRDSLIWTWSEMVGHGMKSGRALPGFFDCGEVHELLNKLLEDALSHMTAHADKEGKTGGYFKGKIAINPKQKPKKKSKMQKRRRRKKFAAAAV